MKLKKHLASVVLLLLVGSFFLIPRADAATPIAKISAYDGEVSVLSEYKMIKVTRAGQVLKQGDRVQVKIGFATVTFDDGATLNVNPYSSALIQQKEEESGFWIFKVKKTVRRITCFVGKLGFTSGRSIKDNYLQTPTAVAGLRGTKAEIGYDNANNYLNMISGEIAVTYGDFIRGFFENPGVDAAEKNKVFKALEKAAEQMDKARETGDIKDAGKAELDALDAIKAAAEELQKSLDPVVAQAATQELAQIENQITETQQKIEAGTYTIPEPGPTTTAPAPTQTTIATTTTTTTTTTSSTTTTTQYIK